IRRAPIMTFHKALLGKVLLATFASGLFAASALPLAAQAGEVSNRVGDQQGRIAAGLHNGELTPGEYVRDRSHLAAINAQRRYDLARNGGYLKPGQKVQLNRELNRNSTRIYRTKHN
ncbi:MAG: hypothetical protein ACRENA_12780, partial [Vulcanimicrobiaceae bacterium]